MVQTALLNVLDGFLWQKSPQWSGKVKFTDLDREALNPFVNNLWNNAQDDEKDALIRGFSGIHGDWKSLTKKVNAATVRGLPSTRNPKQIYPIAPREIQNFFIEDNIYRIARDAEQANNTPGPQCLGRPKLFGDKPCPVLMT